MELPTKYITETTSRKSTEEDGNGNWQPTKRKPQLKLQPHTKNGDLPENNKKKLNPNNTSDKNRPKSSKDVKKILLPESSPQISCKLVQSEKESEKTQILILNVNQERKHKSSDTTGQPIKRWKEEL